MFTAFKKIKQLSPDSKPESKGQIQHTDSIQISEYQKQNFQEVDVGKSKVGPKLISTDFGPCVAICAKLTTKNFAIYHMVSPFAENLLKEFIDKIKGKTEAIFIFENTKIPVHGCKIPFILVSIYDQLRIEPKRIPIYDYSAVIANAETNEITLAKQVIRTNEFEFKKTKTIQIPISSAIPIEDSIKTIIHLTQINLGPENYCMPESLVLLIDAPWQRKLSR